MPELVIAVGGREMWKLIAGAMLMFGGITWYFGWPGALFSAGSVLVLLGMEEVQANGLP